VRDRDAHGWIEVYFQGYGWVPFNPPPRSASPVVASGLDLLPGPGDRASAAGARVEPSSPLGELADMLAGRLGPRTAALAAAAERARYASPATAAAPQRRAGVVRALVADVGPVRAARLLVAPTPRAPSRRRA
jgi:transglutaminase-like putative cysteine protease